MNYGYDPEIIEYAIQAGDSLWDIADDFDTSAEAIIAANPGIDFNNLYIGQVISILDDLPVSAEQFRRFGHGFRGPFFRRRFPFRRFGGFPFGGFVGPFWWW